MPYSKTHQQKIKSLINKVRNVNCKDCGLLKEGQMTFDHLPEFEKKFTLANAKHRSVGAVLAEIAKCEVVCRACHDKREYARGVFKVKDASRKKERNRRKRQRWRQNRKRRGAGTRVSEK